MKLRKKDIVEFAVFVLVVLIVTFVKQKITQAEKETQFETYVFIDHVDVLHTSSDCKGIKPPKDADALKIQELRKTHLQKICSRCVTEQQLEELTKMVEP